MGQFLGCRLPLLCCTRRARHVSKLLHGLPRIATGTLYRKREICRLSSLRQYPFLASAPDGRCMKWLLLRLALPVLQRLLV